LDWIAISAPAAYQDWEGTSFGDVLPTNSFHFAFTDYYFGMLGADLRPFPLAGGVAASAAFPALIDTERLPDRCHSDGRSAVPVLQLMDGGANDNQGLLTSR
jgi:hypothetical protein